MRARITLGVATITILLPAPNAMLVIACPAPVGAIEPAPLTSLPLGDEGTTGAEFTAFWAADDHYYVRAAHAGGESRWFRIESGSDADLATDASRRSARCVIGHVGAREGHVPFPVGSTGRTVFRVWRAKGGEKLGRTRILAVRAARSRRLPA
jgi:hypothetical protein